MKKSAHYGPARSPVEENGPGLLMSMHGRQMPVPPEWLGELGQGQGVAGRGRGSERSEVRPSEAPVHTHQLHASLGGPSSFFSPLILGLVPWITLPRSSPASARFRDFFPSYCGVPPAPQSQASAV